MKWDIWKKNILKMELEGSTEAGQEGQQVDDAFLGEENPTQIRSKKCK